MKLYEKYELESSTGTRHRWFNYYACAFCNKIYRKQKRLSEGATQEFYCSKTCYSDSTKPEEDFVKCAHCGVTFTKNASKRNNSKSGLYFCCRKHKDIGQTYIEEIQPEHYGTGTGEHSYRKLAFSKLNSICNECGISIYEVLEVHHIDKNRDNNDISNLEILCANCHTLEHKGLRTRVQS